MLTFFQAIILGLAQGHHRTLPHLELGSHRAPARPFGWNINQNAETFLEFLVATHLATAIGALCDLL